VCVLKLGRLLTCSTVWVFVINLVR
jgi:hypothetical protein